MSVCRRIIQALLAIWIASPMLQQAVAMPDSNGGESAAPSFEPPYPFTAADLWAKLAQVSALHNQYVMPDQIDSIFGVKLPLLKEHPLYTNDPIYAVKAYRDWYYDLTLILSNKASFFDFGWGQAVGAPELTFHPPTGNICIHSTIVDQTLQQQGWKFKSQTRARDVPLGRQYKFADAKLNVGFDRNTDCLIFFVVMNYNPDPDLDELRKRNGRSQ